MPAARAVRGVSVFFIVGTMRFRQPRILRAPRECDRTLAGVVRKALFLGDTDEGHHLAR